MKKSIIYIIIALLASFIFSCPMSLAQSASAYKDVLNQHLNPETLKSLGLKLKDQKLEIVYTKSSRILVETHIAIEAPNRKIVDYLISQNRYQVELKSTAKEGVYELIPEERSPVLVSGELLEETVWYKLYIPEGTEFYIPLEEGSLDEVLAAKPK